MTLSNIVNPAAIVSKVEETNEQLQSKIVQDLEDAKTFQAKADKNHKNALEKYKSAGENLAKMKERCKHGEWIPWLDNAGIDKVRACECMRIHQN